MLLKKSSILLFTIVATLFILSRCDSPSSVEKEPVDELSPQAKFFKYSPDSVNSKLVIAIDTLRERNKVNPFISGFIDERGLPVWNKASGFYSDGLPVFKVPVRHAQDRKITGIVTITTKDRQLLYSWIPRGAKINGQVSKRIETIMWGYEKKYLAKLTQIKELVLK